MRFSFDINKNYEIPLITLCNPDRKEIASVSNISNLHIKPRFNAVSEVTFDISSVYFDSISNETKTLPYYNLIGKNHMESQWIEGEIGGIFRLFEGISDGFASGTYYIKGFSGLEYGSVSVQPSDE